MILARTQTGLARTFSQGNITMYLSLGIVLTVALFGLLAPIIAPHEPSIMNMSSRMQAPSMLHPFGTDEFGRDVFSRTIYAARISITVGLGAVTLALAIGVPLGLLSGFFKPLDNVLSRLTDAIFTMPEILLAISLVAAFGASLVTIIVVLGVLASPRLARSVRAVTLIIRELPYVEAARSMAVSTPQILFRHVLRNAVSPIIVQGSFIFAHSMIAEAGLSFLGAGLGPDHASWGTMIASGRPYVGVANWIILFPGFAIICTVMSLQIYGDAIRDRMDPRLRNEK